MTNTLVTSSSEASSPHGARLTSLATPPATPWPNTPATSPHYQSLIQSLISPHTSPLPHIHSYIYSQVALLLGVRVQFGSGVDSLNGLRLLGSGDFSDDLAEGVAAPTGSSAETDVGFDVLVDATGARCDMFKEIGFDQVE